MLSPILNARFVLIYIGLSNLAININAHAFDPTAVNSQSVAAEETRASVEPENQKPVAEAADVVQAGKELYGNTCLFCHGASGKGARAPTLISGQWKPGGGNDDDYMRSVIVDGRPGTIMGSFKGTLNKDEIDAVIVYLRDEARLLAEQSENN